MAQHSVQQEVTLGRGSTSARVRQGILLMGPYGVINRTLRRDRKAGGDRDGLKMKVAIALFLPIAFVSPLVACGES